MTFLPCSISVANSEVSSTDWEQILPFGLKKKKEEKIVDFVWAVKDCVQSFVMHLSSLCIFSLITCLPELPVSNICVSEISLFHLQTEVETTPSSPLFDRYEFF